MITHEIQLRVRYAETDQMGYVYYGNYATYFEVARVETFRHIGFSYKEMEDEGIMMPVLEYKTKYIKPARYDDLLTIKIIIKDKPGVRIRFEYEVYNEAKVLLNVSETTLVFVNKETAKPSMPGGHFQQLMHQFFE
jgi:acyl-CoA thioester hydrolase